MWLQHQDFGVKMSSIQTDVCMSVILVGHLTCACVCVCVSCCCSYYKYSPVIGLGQTKTQLSNLSDIHLTMCQTSQLVNAQLRRNHIRLLWADVCIWFPWRHSYLPHLLLYCYCGSKKQRCVLHGWCVRVEWEHMFSGILFPGKEDLCRLWRKINMWPVSVIYLCVSSWHCLCVWLCVFVCIVPSAVSLAQRLSSGLFWFWWTREPTSRAAI